MIVTPTLVILLILTFIPIYLFVKTIDKRKWLNLIVSIVLTPIVYFYMVYPFLNIIVPFHHEKYFNPKAWEKKPGLRYEMINHIQKDSVLFGKTKAEINKLLGTYEWLSWDDSLKQHDDNKWNYGLGLLPGALNEEKECATFIFKNDTLANIERYKEQIVYETNE